MNASWLGIVSVEPGDLNLLGKADLLQHPYAAVVNIELILRQAVTCADCELFSSVIALLV
jgi:hypothetical protein